MGELCDLKIHINGHHTFLLNKSIMCEYSGKLRKMVKQERRRSHSKGSGLKLLGFPGGPQGFELVSSFCYSKGKIDITPSNISVLHCSAVVLEMDNLRRQAETFLDGLLYWSWGETLRALKSCEGFFAMADSSGLLDRLISSLLAKISATSDMAASTSTPLPSTSSSSSSPDTSGFRSCSSTKTHDPIKPREWWFDDLAILPPNIIEKMMRTLGAYQAENKNLVLTRFLLNYLKRAEHRPGCNGWQGYKVEYAALADTAVHGVVLMGRGAFNCRGLFWVLRVVSGLGLSSECSQKLERMMGLVLDQATLDDLLVSGHDGGVYDVGLVLRLVRVFVMGGDGGVPVPPLQRLKKVGRLVDKYLGEISPDQSLKVSKFLSVAESLPDSARDYFDGVYRALDIYLESHPSLSFEERSRMCRCINYEKLTLEACKDLAKNPRIPPGIAVQALVSQQAKNQTSTSTMNSPHSTEAVKVILCPVGPRATLSSERLDDKQDMRLHLQRMRSRVKELEKACKEMKGQMSKMAKSKSIRSPVHHTGRGLPKLC